MAERRMFAKTIVLSDAFLDMPMSARCLYFTLGMVADDDGFVNSPRSIMRQVGASDDDMKLLIAKRYVIVFDSGVIVIKHWRIHNYIQKDRYKPTKYDEEKALLSTKDNGAYTLEIPCIQNGYKMDTQDRLGKDSIGQSSTEQESKGECEGEPKPTYVLKNVPRQNDCLTEEKKSFGKYVRLTTNEFNKLLSEFGTAEFYRRKDAVDVPENEGKDFVDLIRNVGGDNG